MRCLAAAFAVVGALAVVEAFHLPPSQLRFHGPLAGARPSLAPLPSMRPLTLYRPRQELKMLVEPTGTDAFKRIAAQGQQTENLLHKLSSNQAKILKFATVPAAVLGAFVGLPKASFLAKTAVGAVAGFLTKKANDKVRIIRQAGAEAAVAQLLLEADDDMDAISPMVLKSVTSRYDVEYAQHLRIMKNLYTQYLLALLVWPDVRMFEPKALVDLSTALGLDGSSVGDAHCDAAYEVSKLCFLFLY